MRAYNAAVEVLVPDRARKGWYAVAVAGTLVATALAQNPTAAYYDDAAVTLTFADAQRASHRPPSFGPWRLGELAEEDRPHDRRPNLYVVVPGAQYKRELWESYDHNLVLSLLPKSEDPVEFDVIWAVVLDPSLRADYRAERDLILDAQATFTPGDLFDFSDVPGRAVLRDFFDVHSLRDLRRFRRKDRSLPRVLLLPAGFAVRVAVNEPSGNSNSDKSSTTQPGPSPK